MNILFTICGREGSKGFKNKNLKKMNGIPLVYYTFSVIRLYKDCHNEDSVITALNTDSQRLKGLASNQHILEDIIFVNRKMELAGDTVPKVDVIRDTYESVRSFGEFDVIVDLDITSPMRRLVDVENVIQIYQDNLEYDLVFSVVEARRSPYFNMVERKSDGNYRKICESIFTARQQAPICYELNASIYAYRPKFLKNNMKQTILDYNCGISIMPDYLVLDIDSEKDFEMMQFLHTHYCEVDSDLRNIYKIAGDGGF